MFPLNGHTQSQETLHQCGTVADPDSYLHDFSYANNEKLIEIIMQEDIPIPEGYFEYLGMENPTDRGRAAEPGKTYIPIKLWVYRNNNGTGNINTAQAYQIIDDLNDLYATNTNFVFYLLCDISFINNSNYANNGHTYFNTYTLNNWTPKTLDVHIVISSSEWTGKANFPFAYEVFGIEDRSFSCAVVGNNPKVLAHEIGHALGLYHTHHPGRNKSHNTNGQCGDCYQEAVSRSKTQGLVCIGTVGQKKCEVNGDFLCDTAADPLLTWGNVNPLSCSYTGGGTDNWGDTWVPNATNIMSYTYLNCMSYFSPMQAAKMTYYKNVMNAAYPTFTISGPDRLCAGATATYSVTSLPGVTEYDWQVPSSMYITSSPPYGSSISVQATHSSGGQISVLPNCGSRPAYFTVKNTSSYVVSGYDSGCPNESYTYSVPYISGALYYWEVIENATIQYGQNTNIVTVKLLPDSSNQSWIRARVEYCSGSYGYGHKIITHGDPPPPAPQCFAPTEGEDNKSLETAIQDLIMYPNPAENSVTLLIPGNDVYDLSVINVNGQVVYSQNNLKEAEYTINTATYNSGIYFVTLTAPTGTTTTKRLIIKK